jgi:hypothetical protein
MKLPTPVTLKKYGLTEQDWINMFVAQDGKCPICENPLIYRTNIDHFHVKKWKMMPPEQRKLYVRGILCWTCNRLIVGRGVTLKRLKAATLYLETFEEKIKNEI